MEKSDIQPAFRKWMKQCIKEEFEETIEKELDKDQDSHDIAEKIIQSNGMKEFLVGVKTAFDEQQATPRNSSVVASESRPQTGMSFASELSGEEWGPLKNVQTDHYAYVVNRIGYDKPVHVRLAGYEALFDSELARVDTSGQSWDVLLKALRDGIADESKPIFEASLQAHAKLLNGSQSQEVFTNLLSAFNVQYHSRRLHDMLPTLLSGINFKVFLHEKLFRIMHLIVQQQEEALKNVRNAEKFLEEMIEQFVTFLSSHTFGNSTQTKTLNILNIISVLEPQADWSKKWVHSLGTRKTLISALGKSPALLQHVVYSVRKGLVEPPVATLVSVTDEPAEVNISGDTVETATYLHCLCFLSQLCSNTAGRTLLSEIQLDEQFDVPEFLLALLNSLNILATSEAPSGIYDTSRRALQNLLEGSSVLYDAKFHDLALSPLMRSPKGEGRIYPHMFDIMTHILDTEDGANFMISVYGRGSAGLQKSISICPAVAVLEYASNLLRQPLSVMNVEHIVDLFQFIARLFETYEACRVSQDVLKEEFYPAITYLYNKMDKYSMENENKTQILDSSAKSMLLKIVSVPLGLRLLTRERLVFEELLRGSLAPLRASWSSTDVVGFVSSSALLTLGSEILSDLAPHVLSTTLADLCKKLEDPQSFHDPWDDDDVKKFLHILRLLSLNASCFTAFLDNANQENSSEDESYPMNLRELLQHSVNFNSPYHYLGLLALNVFIQNLDSHIYLQHLLNFQVNLLKLQEYCIMESENEDEPKTIYMVDECSLLRHQVLSNSYNIGLKYGQNKIQPEHCMLFSKLPPPQRSGGGKSLCKQTSHSELARFLQESKPGLKDNGWVSQARKAHKVSSKDPIKHSALVDLVDQMQKAIPVFELTSHYRWPTIHHHDQEFLLPEEIHGINLALHYAEENRLMQDTPQSKENLKLFLESAHGFINYGKPKKFEGFDWFIATVFIICGGNMEKSIAFVSQMVRFPSTLYIWPTLGRIVSQSNEFPVSTRFTFAQCLEGIISSELPTIKNTLKSNCGTDWWMICDGLLSQCFWGTLPWSEIVQLFAICILYPPDYALYYCTSLAHYGQHQLLRDVNRGKMWPEHMILDGYRCHDHFALMERLAKRHRNKVLSTLTLHDVELTT